MSDNKDKSFLREIYRKKLNQLLKDKDFVFDKFIEINIEKKPNGTNININIKLLVMEHLYISYLLSPDGLPIEQEIKNVVDYNFFMTKSNFNLDIEYL